MTYPPPPQYPQYPAQPQGPKARPATVTAVVWTQILTAVVLLATAVAMFSVKSVVEDEMIAELDRDPDLQGVDTSMINDIVTFTFVAIAAVYIVFAIFYVVLGLLNNGGKRPARILSWILSGIALLCCGFGGLIGQVGSTSYSMNDTEYNDELTQAVEDATPGWVTSLEWVSLLMFIAGSLLIIILLAMPASNDFFRKEPLAQPPYPGQPPYGGQQPPYGQQPPGPGQPPAPGQ